MSLNIALRCDASAEIGTGHLMRCLTLAEALRALGHRCTFIARDLPNAPPGTPPGTPPAPLPDTPPGTIQPGTPPNIWAETVTARGFALVRLPAPDAAFTPDSTAPAHAIWAGVPWQRDAAETRAVLQSAPFDWLILDHYAFEIRWQNAVMPTTPPATPPTTPPATLRLAVIDDLADRAHRCDVLLDQNLGRKAADYDGLIPATAERLIGPEYALLRPEFAALRAASLARRAASAGALRHILIAMGGVDQPAMSLALLEALARLPPFAKPGTGAAIDVVMGGAAPSLARVQARAAQMPVPCRVHVDTPDMAALMAGADLAIGGIGGTAWERCSLGLPCLLVVMAENQAAGARALVQAGAGVLLGAAGQAAAVQAAAGQAAAGQAAAGQAAAGQAAGQLAGDTDLPQRLHAALQSLSQPPLLRALGAQAAAVTTGLGTAHMVARLCAPALHLRPATHDDAPDIWQWRNSIAGTDALKSGKNPSLHDHRIWLAAALQSPARRLYMACTDHALGHLRLDDCVAPAPAPAPSPAPTPGPGPHTATISLLLAPGARGRGLGRRILALAEAEARRLGLHALLAEISLANTASRRAFTAAGYQPGPQHAGFVTMILHL